MSFIQDRFNSDNTKDRPDANFALQGSINWMRGLSIAVEEKLANQNIKEFYSKVNSRVPHVENDNLVFENIILAYNNLCSLKSINKEDINRYDITSLSIVAWYYTIYFSSLAMISATSGSPKESHSENISMLQNDIINRKLIPFPYSLNLTSIKEDDVKTMLSQILADATDSSNTYPISYSHALGAMKSYLSGTAKYERWRVEGNIKNNHKINNFRTQANREIRDSKFKKSYVNFLRLAYRYRGKANYRDAIFLSHAQSNPDKMIAFIKDLELTAEYFFKCASYYSSKRVQDGIWDKFIDDLKSNSKLSIDITDILNFDN